MEKNASLEMSPKKKILVVDGNSILNRAFFGVRPLSTKDGRFTNAIYGFLGTLNRVMTQERPESVAVAFDERQPTFRHQMYDGYKAQRKGMPQELAEQLAPTKEILTLLGLPVVSCPGYEADDILGTLSKQAASEGWQCVLVTGDRDSLQLVGESVHMLYASAKKGADSLKRYDPAAVQEEYGLPPSLLVDLKSLMGDSSDNIPGAAGIGQKTATALLCQHGSLTGVYDHLEQLTPLQRKKLEDSREMVGLSRKLAEICCSAPLASSPTAYLLRPCQGERARAFFARYELSSMEKRWAPFLQERPDLSREDLGERDAPAEGSAGETGLPEIETVDSPAASFWQGTLAFTGDWGADGLWQWGAFLTEGQAYFPPPPEIPGLLREHRSRLRVWQGKPLYRFGLRLGQAPEEMQPFAFDGELAAYLRNPAASGYDLLTVAKEYGVKPRKLTGLPPGLCLDEEIHSRLGVLWETLGILADRLGQSPALSRVFAEIELPLSLVLAKMEHEGFALDAQGLRDYGGQLNRELIGLTEEIYDMAGMRFNLNSPKQLGHVLFEVLGLPPSKKTKTGYSTNAQVLEELASLHPVVDKLLRSRKLSKLTSTYVEGLLQQVGADGRVHSTFLQTEARTGRISSTEPNLQNIPVRTQEGAYLRRFFHPRKSWLLIDADYSQIELRILAHMADDQAMIQAFQRELDVHTLTASQVFGVPQTAVSKEMRSRAKAVNFGIVYGMGAFSLSREIGVTVKEADAYIKGYLRTYPGVAAFMTECIRQGQEQGYVETMLGRRRYVPELSASNKTTRAMGERIAMNSPVQGSAADVIKIAMINVSRRLEKEGMQTRLILQVHDELLLEAPMAEAEQAARLLQEEMEQAVSLKVPLTAEVNILEKWEK